VYATEKRRLPGYEQPVDCVLLDSVQSQANRMEEALQRAIDAGKLKLPLVEVDFTPFFPGTDKPETLRLVEPVGKVTSLQAPHRIVDAILRDSIVEEEIEEEGEKKKVSRPFRSQKNESSFGQRLGKVNAQNATALFELCPTALLLGMWDSTGPKGGLGVKFERAIVSEVVGIDAQPGVKTSSRIDPLAIQKGAGPLYKRVVTPDQCGPEWTLDESEAERDKDQKPIKFERGGDSKSSKPGDPSKANHSNYPPSIDIVGGFTVRSADQTVVLSFPALRRLRFPLTNDKQELVYSNAVDEAARTVLASLGLCAAALAAEAGLDLRSRCLLWPTSPLTWELLSKPGHKDEGLTLEANDAILILKEAIDAAKQIGLPWREAPLCLIPSEQLVKLVLKSQRLALAQGGEGGE
jgi:CRISPR-associated protein Csb1